MGEGAGDGVDWTLKNVALGMSLTPDVSRRRYGALNAREGGRKQRHQLFVDPIRLVRIGEAGLWLDHTFRVNRAFF